MTILYADDESPEFEDFLQILGRKITLKGWPEYRGGLNVTGTYFILSTDTRLTSLVDVMFSTPADDSTGKHSIYTTWRDYEIMFHVSTYLPFSPFDRQQVPDSSIAISFSHYYVNSWTGSGT